MMSKGVIDRLRHAAQTAPSLVVSVYPGDVIEEYCAVITRAEAAEKEAKRARQLLRDVYDAFSYAWPLEYVEETGEFLANTKDN